ncbi:hypothetical protein BKA70DRAFT_1523147 [Coprinopsis sp. MPI-PUGE-AT-0042]|nr:hypothetical protein BKA70DRAFT_1523147 [Coprinopsis sp. MPI-PUGE-AT-0042]
MLNYHPYTDPVLAEYYPSTNNGLPDALIPRCLEHKMRIEGLLSTASAEVRRIQTLLDAAHQAHDALFEEHLACNSLLSPIRRVPEEILSEILLWTFDHPVALKELDIMRLTHLQLVCRKWRNAAHSCHELWRGLDIRTPMDGNREPNVAVFQRWFSRAGSDAPLSLALRGVDDTRVLGGPSDEALVRYLAAESRNLAYLALLKVPTFFTQSMLNTAREDLHPQQDSQCWSTLRTLSLEGNSPHDPLHFPANPHLLPHLRTLSLTGAVMQPGPNEQLPSVEFLYLGTFSCDASTFFTTVSAFPSLKELKISEADVTGELEPGTKLAKTINRMKISRVVLAQHESRLFLGMEPRLPFLEELRLEDMYLGDGWWLQYTTQFLGRHPLKLLSLEGLLDLGGDDAGQLSRLSKSISNVREIHVPSFEFLGSLKKQKKRAYFADTTRIIATKGPTPGLMERMFRVFEDRRRLSRAEMEIGVREGWPAWFHRDGWPGRMQQVGVSIVEF